MEKYALAVAVLSFAARAELTPAQQKILASPAQPPPSAEFSFSFPGGPEFTDAEKRAQREAGKTVLPLVLAAFSNGAESVRIPPGDYRFGSEHWGRDGVHYALEFSGLQRDAAHPFTIDATGATFWFDLPDDQAPHAHFACGFKNCRNVIFRGATLDRGTRGQVEGRITQLDAANKRIELELSPGITVPATFNDKTEQRIVPFKSDGRFCAPLYALQAGGVHLKYKSITPGSAAGRVFVTMQDTKLFDTLRDTQWQKTYGELGTLQIGDGLSCVYSVACGVELVGCEHCTLDGLRVFITKGWGAERGGVGGHLWKNCYFGPRPGTSRWQGGEGFMFNATRQGTTLDGVVIRHTADDVANVHSYWGHIKNVVGSRVTFEMPGEFRHTVAKDALPGDMLLFRDKNSGRELGAVTLVAFSNDTATVDRSVEHFTNAIVEWTDHECANWLIQRCTFQDCYQRLLIQSGPGVVRGCAFTRLGSSLEINSDFPYVEGGVARDLTIADNIFTDVNTRPNGAAIAMHTHTYGREAPPFSNFVITGNIFERYGSAAIALDGVQGAHIVSNHFARPLDPAAQPIQLKRCTAIREEGNLTGDAAVGLQSTEVREKKRP
ncbi:MAG: hypothetical protein NTY53_05965 [Kiritimatiellaeota bacterium]|nr:hypothetical protein [Kiritimatiellota bacterium]